MTYEKYVTPQPLPAEPRAPYQTYDPEWHEFLSHPQWYDALSPAGKQLLGCSQAGAEILVMEEFRRNHLRDNAFSF